MVKTKKRKSKHKYTRKRNGGGDIRCLSSEGTVAIKDYIRNISSQILQNIENKPHDNEDEPSSYFKRLSNTKIEIYRPWFESFKISFGEFKTTMNRLVNMRNDSIHPSKEKMKKLAQDCVDLVDLYKLNDELKYEYYILLTYLRINEKTKKKTIDTLNIGVANRTLKSIKI